MPHRLKENAIARKGVTGLETAIILIAFVVVASVFAFTVLSTGVFSAERSKDTIYAGLEQARASLEPRGSLIGYRGANGSGTPVNTIYKLAFIVAPSIGGQPIDLTPPYTKNDTSIDPDFSANAEYRTVISYHDQNQQLPDVPWTVDFLGNSNGDFLLETGEKAEITVWLLARNYAQSDIDAANATATWVADSRGAHGILTTGGTLLTANDKFTMEIKPDFGSSVTIQRDVPIKLDPVMDLR